MLANTTVTPYYGVAYVTDPRDSQAKGYSVTSMLSGNFNMRFGDTAMNHRPEEGGVCTGDRMRTSLSGWLTLSRVTTNSMYYEDIISMPEAFYFTQASKEIANELWKSSMEEEDKAMEEAIDSAETEEKNLRTITTGE
jgi:hypothetical protein